MREALMVEQMKSRLFVRIEPFHGGREIGMKLDRPGGGRLRGLRRVRGLPVRLPAPPPCVADLVVRNSEDPGEKARIPAKLAKPPVGPQECLLGQVVGQRGVSPQKVAQETPDGGLVPKHKLPEGSAVVRAENTAYELGIRRIHAGAAFGQGRLPPGGGPCVPGPSLPRVTRQ